MCSPGKVGSLEKKLRPSGNSLVKCIKQTLVFYNFNALQLRDKNTRKHLYFGYYMMTGRHPWQWQAPPKCSTKWLNELKTFLLPKKKKKMMKLIRSQNPVFPLQNHRFLSAISTAASLPSEARSSSEYLFTRLTCQVYRGVSIVPILEKWVDEGRAVQKTNLQGIIKKLRKMKRYAHALEVISLLLGNNELKRNHHSYRHCKHFFLKKIWVEH